MKLLNVQEARCSLSGAELASLGQRLHADGRLEAAASAFQLAVESPVAPLQSWLGLASVRLELGLPRRSLEACNAFLEAAPDAVDGLFATAIALSRIGLYAPACHAYERVLAARPQHFGALLNLPDCLLRAGRAEDALVSARTATEIFPEYPDLWFNLGEIFVTLEQHQEALCAYQRVLTLDPSVRKAEAAIAVEQAAVGDLLGASARLNKLRETAPEVLRSFASPLRTDTLAAYPELEAGRIALIAAYHRYRSCDWRDRNEFAALFERVVRGEGCRPLDNPDLPFLGIALPVSGEVRLRAARQVAERIARSVVRMPLIRSRRRSESPRLRIAYVSGDFRQHPTSYLVHRLFSEHDRRRFEVIAYSTGPEDDSDYRRNIRDNADVFVDVSHYDSRTFAQRVVRDQIDILVDLQGYTLYAKSEVFALRPAPVQVTYLAYLMTLGAAWSDYAILDRNVLTPEERPYWKERIAYLPDTLYLCDDESVVEERSSRTALGLPEAVIIYCCLNAPWKISPEDVRLWVRILSAVPGAVLWLYSENSTVSENLCAAIVNAGGDASRLFFAPRVSHKEHLQRFGAADIFLDTRECNAHTTGIEALAAGLPLVTWPGESVVSRVGASLLRAHGVPELVASSADDYVAIAVRLGLDAAFCRHIGDRVRDRSKSRLFSTGKRVREIERAYETMWATYRAGTPPTDFDVPREE